MSDTSSIPKHHQPFTYIPEIILSIAHDKLSSTKKLILSVIATKQLLDANACTLSTGSMAEKLGISCRSVRNSLSDLRKQGYVKCDERPGQTNRLNLNEDKIRALSSGELETCEASEVIESTDHEALGAEVGCTPDICETPEVNGQGGGS